MPLECPRCQSTRIGSNNYGKKTAGVVGAGAGAVGGVNAASTGAMYGGVIGLVGGPVGVTVGRVTGAIIGGLVGGTTGASAGVALGSVLDEQVLDNYRCLDCRYCFRNAPSEESEASADPG